MSLEETILNDAKAIADTDGVQAVFVPLVGEEKTIGIFITSGPLRPRSSSGGEILGNEMVIQIARLDVPEPVFQKDAIRIPGTYTESQSDEVWRLANLVRSRDPGWWVIKLRKQ